MCVCVCVFVCVCVYIYIYMYMYICACVMLCMYAHNPLYIIYLNLYIDAHAYTHTGRSSHCSSTGVSLDESRKSPTTCHW